MNTLNKNIITFPFTESFIENLADYIVSTYPVQTTDYSRLAIVFGGKRPALFLKRALAKRIKKDFIAPRFFNIDEFLHQTLLQQEEFTAIQDLDNAYLMFTLAQEKTPEILVGRASFAEFLPWSREVLKFIDQLDLENIDNNKLTSVKKNAQIGYNVPDDINKLLEHVVTLRDSYHKALLQKKTYSRGFQYLRAAQLIKTSDLSEFDHIIFGNFFYFNRSEEIVIQHLFDTKQATLVFQGDSRRWPVLNRTAERFAIDISEGKDVIPTKFNLNLHRGFDAHSQVSLVRNILSGIKNHKETVIVLPNPDHIIPLLSEVSSLVQDFNISMGYPLKRSSLYALLQLVFKTQLSYENKRYYAKDYLKTMRHPFIKNLDLVGKPSVARILIHKIEELLKGQEKSDISGSLFLKLEDIEECTELYDLTKDMLKRLDVQVSTEELRSALKEMHDFLFRRWEDVHQFTDFGDNLSTLIDLLIDKSFMHLYPLNINIAHKITMVLKEFINASFRDELFTKEDMFRIFEGKIDSEIVAFVGSPLKGMQMLGLFETRALNFENVIILDVNEGVLPHLSEYEPLIPREVMIGLNLDRMELEEEIQRYQFMRLISSAKNVHLVYQENNEKERSRFVEELIWEEEKAQNKMDVIQPQEASFQVKIGAQNTEIYKTPEMITFLKNHRYSASSINTYLRNPMDFYYSYCLGLREKEDLLDEPGAMQVGTFMHDLLEDQFKPFINKAPLIDNDFKKHFMEVFKHRFKDNFERVMKSDAFLLKSVMEERLLRFLAHEQESVDRRVNEVLYLEERFSDVLDLSCGSFEFSYIVDRIDRMDTGEVMIVDYKTGANDIMPQTLEKIERLELSRESIRDHVKSFQLPLYFNFLTKKFPNEPVNAVLYNLRTLKINKFIKKQPVDPDRINEVYLKSLDYIMDEIINPDIPFIDDPI